MNYKKQCPRCRSLEKQYAVFCSQCTMRLALPDFSYKVLLDDECAENRQDLLPVTAIVIPLIALIVVVAVFLNTQ